MADRYEVLTSVNKETGAVEVCILMHADAAGDRLIPPALLLPGSAGFDAAVTEINGCRKPLCCRIELICKCDDVNGDGSDIQSYVEPFLLTSDGTSISSVSQGTFTDESLSVPYTPVNPADCCEIGQEAEPALLMLCDDNGTFIRYIDVFSGSIIREMDLDGNHYEPVGEVRGCSNSTMNQNLVPVGTVCYQDN